MIRIPRHDVEMFASVIANLVAEELTFEAEVRGNEFLITQIASPVKSLGAVYKVSETSPLPVRLRGACAPGGN